MCLLPPDMTSIQIQYTLIDITYIQGTLWGLYTTHSHMINVSVRPSHKISIYDAHNCDDIGSAQNITILFHNADYPGIPDTEILQTNPLSH